MIPLLRKLPELLEIAKNNFAKYDSALHNPMYGTGNTFAALNTLLSPGGFGMMGMNPGMMGMNPGMQMNPNMQMNMNPAMMNNMQMNNQMPNMDPAQMQMMMNMMAHQQQAAQQQGGQTNLFYDNGQTPPPPPPPAQQQQATGKPAQPYTPAPTESSATVTSKMFG